MLTDPMRERPPPGQTSIVFHNLGYVFDARIAGLDILSCGRIVGKLPTGKAQSSQLVINLYIFLDS
jgi:hypothetical protein